MSELDINEDILKQMLHHHRVSWAYHASNVKPTSPKAYNIHLRDAAKRDSHNFANGMEHALLVISGEAQSRFHNIR